MVSKGFAFKEVLLNDWAHSSVDFKSQSKFHIFPQSASQIEFQVLYISWIYPIEIKINRRHRERNNNTICIFYLFCLDL